MHKYLLRVFCFCSKMPSGISELTHTVHSGQLGFYYLDGFYSNAACSENQNNFSIGRTDFHGFICPFLLSFSFHSKKIYQPLKTAWPNFLQDKSVKSTFATLWFTSRCLKM